MKAKQEPITHAQALDQYFGGVKKIAPLPFPWKCKCKGGFAYSMKDVWTHITEGHGEKLKS